MRRSHAISVIALMTLLLVASLASCEDLQYTVLCGDGVVGFGETCDGTVPPGLTCESQGYYDGVVRCGADCRFDVTGCRRCGDGVLDTDEGERYEVGLETCLRYGFLGGDHQTWDCRFFHPETCTNYRTVSQDPPVSRPVLALDARGRLWLSGLVRGAFPGYTERPGCPDIHRYWYESYSKGYYSRYMGYIIDPICDQEFLAFYDAAGRLKVPSRPSDEGVTGRMLALTDGEVALVRRTATQVALTAVDASGVSHRSTLLENASLPELWSVEPLPDGRLGIVRPSTSFLEALVLDPWQRVDSVAFKLDRVFTYKGLVNQHYSSATFGGPDLYGARLPVAWESPDTVSLIIGVQRLEGQGPNGLHWVRLQGEGDLARVTHMVYLTPPLDGLDPFKLHVDPVAGTLSVAWKIGESALHLQRLSWTGETLVSWRYTLRAGRIFEALDFTSDGGAILAGTVNDWNGPIPFNDATCSKFGSGYFAERLSAGGFRVSESSFTAPGIFPGTYARYSEICDEVTRAYIFTGDGVTVGGTHMSDSPFCDRSEILPTYDDDPFVICNIHLVRLTP